MPDKYMISGPNSVYHPTVRYLIEKKGLEEGKRLHPDYIKMLKYLRYFLFFSSVCFGKILALSLSEVSTPLPQGKNLENIQGYRFDTM